MCFVVVHSTGLWIMENFFDSLALAREVNKPDDKAVIVENSTLTKIIMEM